MNKFVREDDDARRPKLDKNRELFDKYIMPNYDFIMKLCERYTEFKQDVDENFNDVLLNLFVYINTYDSNRDLRTWIHIVTKRHVFGINKQRQKYGNSFQCIDSIEGFTVELDDADFENDSSVNGEYSDEVSTVLELMPKIHRKAFEMQLAGYSLKEIAKILNESGELDSNNINTVKTRIFNARKFVKRHIDKDGNIIDKTQNNG